MSETPYLAICAVCAAAGFIVGRWRVVQIALAIWALAVAAIAVTGGFHATGEDNSLGVFVFTAIPALFWVAFVAAGVLVRRLGGAWRARTTVGR